MTTLAPQTDADDLVSSPMDLTWVVSGHPRTQVALWDCTARSSD